MSGAAEYHAQAIRHVVGGVLKGFDVDDEKVVLRFGRNRELVIEGRPLMLRARVPGVTFLDPPSPPRPTLYDYLAEDDPRG